MTSAPPIVVVVTYNSAPVLGTTLQAVEDYDVQVVDNGSRDDSLAIASAYKNVDILRSPSNVGYGAAANAAALLHPERDLLVLNPDAVPHAGAVDLLSRALSNQRVGVVGPRLLYPDGALQFSARNYQTLGVVLAERSLWGASPRGSRASKWHRQPSLATGSESVAWLTGAAMLFRRSAFDEIGGFDERYFMYHEDQDICYRMRKQGWDVVYDPAAVMTHQHAQASRSNLRAARRHLRSTALFYHLHPELLIGRTIPHDLPVQVREKFHQQDSPLST